MKKKVIIIIIIVITILSLIASLYLLYVTNIIPHKMYKSEDFNIKVYKSNVDKDNDSIDDQTDILMNARIYIAKNPKYKSKYYGSGYPDDEYGVCTDVIGYALYNAGYDIKELLYNDVINNRKSYDIDVVDKNIDFRRVNNLNTYFKRNAISLTTDIKNIDEWQGGDIVVFKKHIAIVSNMRNYKGVPFIIHHVNTFQRNYEEDKLSNYKNEIVGHYRIS